MVALIGSQACAQTGTVDATRSTRPRAQRLSGKVSDSTLKGTVTQTDKSTPLLTGSVQALPKGTKVDLTALVNINSEICQKGDEIWMQVSHDVPGGSGVAVPGGWYVHGLVTEAKPQRRGGRDGYVTIQFDKMVGPDKQTEVPFDAKVSTKDSLLKAVAKHVAIDTAHVGLGAVGGSIFAVQMTGISTAIATHGISVGAGAALGATLGAIGAAKRKGSIAAVFPGEELKLVTDEPIVLPGFNSAALLSAKPAPVLKNMEIQINKFKFSRDPFGDSSSSLMKVDLTMNNNTEAAYKFTELAVVSDHNQRYYPSFLSNVQALTKMKVEPNQSATGEIAFSVDGKKHKYWLVLLDKSNSEELSRVPIN